MKVVRCEKKLHWYDADAYPICPHCNPGAGKLPQSDTAGGKTPSIQRGFATQRDAVSGRSAERNGADPFGRFPEEGGAAANAGPAFSPADRWDPTVSAFSPLAEEPPYDPAVQWEPSGPAFSPDPAGPSHGSAQRWEPTVSAFSPNPAYDGWDDGSPSFANAGVPDPYAADPYAADPYAPDPGYADPYGQDRYGDVSISELRQEISDVSNSSVDKTVSYFGRVTAAGGPEAAAANEQASAGGAPVVGWLVCIHGPHFGQSFEIRAGKNAIGRSPDNDIVLSLDPTISGNRHAWVTYEAKHRNFILRAGEGRYPDLNGELVIYGAPLKTYDLIGLGEETVLMFVALCGENFGWETYLNKE